MRQFWTPLVVALVLCVGITSAQATTVLYVSIEQLYERSDLAVRGTVEDHVTFWLDGQMFTDWAIRVDEVLAGGTRPIVFVRQLGGELDGLMAHIPGDAELRDGEHLILFLVEDAAGDPDLFYLTALSQSKMTITFDPHPAPPVATRLDPSHILPPGSAIVVRDLSNLAFFDMEAGAYYEVEDAELMTLDELRAMSPDHRVPHLDLEIESAVPGQGGVQ